MPEVAGDAGLLVDPYDVDSITRALQIFLSDKIFVRNLGHRAIINAQRFNWKLTAQQTLHVIEDAVQSHKK